MHQRQYTITAKDVQRHASHVFQQHLKLRDHGPKCTAGTLLGVLFYASGGQVSRRAGRCQEPFFPKEEGLLRVISLARPTRPTARAL